MDPAEKSLDGGPPKSRFVRNCVACGCVLVALAVVAFVAIPVYLSARVASAKRLGESAAPIASALLAAGPPPGHRLKGGIDLEIFGQRVVTGVVFENAETKHHLAWGALGTRAEERGQLRKQIEDAVAQLEGRTSETEQVDARPDEELRLGSGEKVIATPFVVTGRKGERRLEMLVVLEPFENELGWLAIWAAGPEKDFDRAGFAAFLAGIRKK